MLKQLSVALITGLAGIALAAVENQSPASAKPSPSASAAAKAPASPTGRSSTFTGTVVQYLLTPRGEVEGVLLRDGTTVRLSPSAGSALTSQIKPGDRVTITADAPVPPSSPQGRGVHATAITAEKNNRTVTDKSDSSTTSPAAPAAGRHMEVRGHIVRVLRNGAGEADGVLLAAGQQVRMPPAMGRELAQLNESSPGGEVRASGMGVKTDYGTVIDALSVRYGDRMISSKEQPPSPPAIPGR